MPRQKKMVVKRKDPEKPTTEDLQQKLQELQGQKEPLNKDKGELEAQIRQIDDQINEVRTQMKIMRAELVISHIDSLLALTPNHDRTSCSDDNLMNTDRGCARCVLLEAKQMGYLDHEIEVTVEVSRR